MTGAGNITVRKLHDDHGQECYEAWREERDCPHERTTCIGCGRDDVDISTSLLCVACATRSVRRDWDRERDDAD